MMTGNIGYQRSLGEVEAGTVYTVKVHGRNGPSGGGAVHRRSLLHCQAVISGRMDS
jgi:hypothetical protein